MKNLIAVCILCAVVPAVAKTKAPPPAPLPAEITQANTAFLVNDGGNDAAYDAAYQELTKWGKYKLLGSPVGADLVISIEYVAEDHGRIPYSFYNPAIHQVQYGSASNNDLQVKMSIMDPASHTELWSSAEKVKETRLARNEPQQIAKSAIKLVGDLESRSK